MDLPKPRLGHIGSVLVSAGGVFSHHVLLLAYEACTPL
jgi:hypothetical protein